jgi:hypothetical protein
MAFDFVHWTTCLQLTTFLQFCPVSSVLSQSPYFFPWYFLFECNLYKNELFQDLHPFAEMMALAADFH